MVRVRVQELRMLYEAFIICNQALSNVILVNCSSRFVLWNPRLPQKANDCVHTSRGQLVFLAFPCHRDSMSHVLFFCIVALFSRSTTATKSPFVQSADICSFDRPFCICRFYSAYDLRRQRVGFAVARHVGVPEEKAQVQKGL